MLSNNIYIVGLMGSGKTSIGKLLSKSLDSEHVDIDQEIVKKTNQTIGEIFENHREKWLSGFALGALHYSEWSLRAAHGVRWPGVVVPRSGEEVEQRCEVKLCGYCALINDSRKRV